MDKETGKEIRLTAGNKIIFLTENQEICLWATTTNGDKI